MSFRQRGTLIAGALIVAMLLPFGATAQGNDIPVVVDLSDLGGRFGSDLTTALIDTLPTRSRSIMSELENLQPAINPDAGDWETVTPRIGLSSDLSRQTLLRASYRQFPEGGDTGAADANYFLEGALGGDHEIKFGVDYYTADTSDLPAGSRISYVYRGDPFEDSLTVPDTDYVLDAGFQRISGYLQDTITFGKLTADIGLRYDREAGISDPSSDVGDTSGSQLNWTDPGLSSGIGVTAGLDIPSSWDLISPRIGLTYDITGDGKNVVKLSAGRYMSQSGQDAGGDFRYGAGSQGTGGAGYIPYRYGYRDWTDDALPDNAAAGLFSDYGPYDFVSPPTLDAPAYDSDYNTPYLDELTLAFEKALSDDLAVSLTGFYKKKHNLMPGSGALSGALGPDTGAPDALLPDAPFDLSTPGAFNPISNARNPLVQIMIISMDGNVTVQVNVGPGTPAAAPVPATLWSAITRMFSPSAAASGTHLSPVSNRGGTPLLAGMVAWGSVEGYLRPSAPAMVRTREPTPVPIVQQGANGLQVFLTNLGNSSGEAFAMQAFNGGSGPVDISAEGLIVEPLKEEIKKQVQQQLQQQLSKLIGDNPVTQRLNAYCLEMFKAPPSLDSMFQIASGDLQNQFAPLKHVMSASKALQDVGLLNPDSDPLGYFHSIRQWSIWSKEEGLDQGGFTDAFVEHTKKQVEDAGQQWSPQFDATLRNAAPNRWGDIERVLAEADKRQQADSGR